MYQYDLDTLRLLTRDRTERRATEARAERLARDARGDAARTDGGGRRRAALRLELRRNATR
jgi:hypothetical protein